MKTREQFRGFLRKIYKHDRFEGRDNATWNDGDKKYSDIIIDGNVSSCGEQGFFGVSHFEAVNGVGGFFDGNLKEVFPYGRK